jgi:hypothetical protein
MWGLRIGANHPGIFRPEKLDLAENAYWLYVVIPTERSDEESLIHIQQFTH